MLVADKDIVMYVALCCFSVNRDASNCPYHCLSADVSKENAVTSQDVGISQDDSFDDGKTNTSYCSLFYVLYTPLFRHCTCTCFFSEEVT